jgi:hypothetical protein
MTAPSDVRYGQQQGGHMIRGIASALVIGIACLLHPALAAGQVATTHVPSGERVLVEHGAEEDEIEGRLLGVEGDELRLDVDGDETRVPLGDVRRLSTRKGNKAARGALWGGLAGAGISVVAITLADEDADQSRDLRRGAFGVAIGAGLGAGIGGLIPQYILVFDRSECRCNPRIVSIGVRPTVSPERRAMSVVLGF